MSWCDLEAKHKKITPTKERLPWDLEKIIFDLIPCPLSFVVKFLFLDVFYGNEFQKFPSVFSYKRKWMALSLFSLSVLLLFYVLWVLLLKLKVHTVVNLRRLFWWWGFSFTSLSTFLSPLPWIISHMKQTPFTSRVCFLSFQLHSKNILQHVSRQFLKPLSL